MDCVGTSRYDQEEFGEFAKGTEEVRENVQDICTLEDEH